MCYFITQSSTLPFIEQFANNVVVDSAEVYLGALWGLWRKRKYPQMKTGKNDLRNCFMTYECNSQSYTFLFFDQFANSVFLNSAMGYLLTQWTLQWQSKYSQKKTEKCFLRNCFLKCEFNSLSYTCISWSRSLALVLWTPRTDISDHFEDNTAKGNILR